MASKLNPAFFKVTGGLLLGTVLLGGNVFSVHNRAYSDVEPIVSKYSKNGGTTVDKKTAFDIITNEFGTSEDGLKKAKKFQEALTVVDASSAYNFNKTLEAILTFEEIKNKK